MAKIAIPYLSGYGILTIGKEIINLSSNMLYEGILESMLNHSINHVH